MQREQGMSLEFALGIAQSLVNLLAPACERIEIAGSVRRRKTEPNDNGDYSHVEVYLADGKYSGRIVFLNSPVYREDEDEGTPGQPRVDTKNPDEKLRGRPLLGMDLMHGFAFNGKNKWEDGRIYDPESGKEYRCKVTMKDHDTLEIFGYVKVAFAKLGRDTIWKRVAEGN